MFAADLPQENNQGAKMYSYFYTYEDFAKFQESVPEQNRNFYQVLALQKPNEYVYEYYDLDAKTEDALTEGPEFL